MEIDIEIGKEKGNCYCCFKETLNKSPCECEAHICKACLKKYRKYETECKICKTKLIFEETNIEILRRTLREKFKNYEQYISLCIIEILFHPITILLLCFTLLGFIIILPSLIYCIFVSFTLKTSFIFVFTLGTWLNGILLILLFIIFFCLFLCLISTIKSFLVLIFY